MRLLRLELHLGPVPRLVQLAELEGAGLEEGTLPIQRVTLPLPDDARVLGFRHWEVGGSGPLSTQTPGRIYRNENHIFATLYH